MWFKIADLKAKYGIDPKVIAHVGAHYGEEVDEYLANGAEKIYLFEPLAANCEVIMPKIRNKPVWLWHVALGAASGTGSMWVSSNEKQSSSLLKPTLHTQQYPHITFGEQVEVNIRRLDDCVAVGTVDFLNMDVQGYELEVLKGGTRTLESVKAIITEVNQAELYENCVQIQELDAFLADFGFERVMEDWIGGTWGDALYLHKSILRPLAAS
jgi:FkbM family methyltransferase